MPFEIVRNDITKMDVDAIVNAANNTLLGGGGVDGAIHRAAGPRLLEECRTLNGCATGQAKVTRGYDLSCKYVIHTVGPIWQGGGNGERALLADCYRNSLALAKEYHCASVAFPLISSGVYDYPRAEALQVAVEEIDRFLAENDMLVYMVVLSRDVVEPAGKLYRDVAAYIDDVYVDEHADAARETRRAGEAAGPEASMGPGSLFRRAHREDNARNETVFDARPARAAGADRPSEGASFRADGGFSELLGRLIREKGISDIECCRRANVDRRLFTRIRNNPDYRPGRRIALAFAVALKLSPDEAKALLDKAGYALSHGRKEDIVAEYCIQNGYADLIGVNLALFKLGLQPLG